MVEVRFSESTLGRAYDLLNLAAILVNLLVCVLMTFDGLNAKYGTVYVVIEAITVLFFAVDYILRIYTAPVKYTEKKPVRAILHYILSLEGIVDLLSFLPYYLPVFFPAGAVAFRLFRIMRIFKLFRINSYYDSLNVIVAVINSKKKQLISSIFILMILMVASSLCMYGVEHETQPEVFRNAMSGIWWAASTLLTVGYGDIYPVTTLGQILGVVIAFLGVFVVAIPTGIISAGFVEQYSRLKQLGEEKAEKEMRFVRIKLGKKDPWVGKTVRELRLTEEMILALILRGDDVVIPEGGEVLQEGDTVVLGAKPCRDTRQVVLREITLNETHPWTGQRIRELDISRQTFVVKVQRGSEVLVPRGDLILKKGDVVMVYSRSRMVGMRTVHI
jgi:voltage-gated potassium channel